VAVVEVLHESTDLLDVPPRLRVRRRRNAHGPRNLRNNSASVYAPMWNAQRSCYIDIHMLSLPACTVITCTAACKHANITLGTPYAVSPFCKFRCCINLCTSFCSQRMQILHFTASLSTGGRSLCVRRQCVGLRVGVGIRVTVSCKGYS